MGNTDNDNNVKKAIQSFILYESSRTSTVFVVLINFCRFSCAKENRRNIVSLFDVISFSYQSTQNELRLIIIITINE